MVLRHALRLVGLAVLIGAVNAAAVDIGATQTPAPLALDTARVSIAGSSNVHAYTAATTVVRVTRVKLGAGVSSPATWEAIAKPGGLETFEVAIPAGSLASPKGDLDKNMHKALKVSEHADITFRLVRLEAGAAGALRAVGALTIAGVEREVAFEVKTERRAATLVVKGELPLLMTDYGVKPPVAMLGMLKTDPKVTVSFDVVLSVPLT